MKRYSLVISFLGIWFILLGLGLSGLFLGLHPFRSARFSLLYALGPFSQLRLIFVALFRLLLILSGIIIFFKKNWARISAIILCVCSILHYIILFAYYWIMPIIIHKNWGALNIKIVASFAIVPLLVYGVPTFFLTRPKVKALFSPPKPKA